MTRTSLGMHFQPAAIWMRTGRGLDDLEVFPVCQLSAVCKPGAGTVCSLIIHLEQHSE